MRFHMLEAFQLTHHGLLEANLFRHLVFPPGVYEIVWGWRFDPMLPQPELGGYIQGWPAAICATREWWLEQILAGRARTSYWVPLPHPRLT
jgi:hypothetical protein